MSNEQTTPPEDLRKAFATGLNLLDFIEVKLGFTSFPTSPSRPYFQVENGNNTFDLEMRNFVMFSMGDYLGEPTPLKRSPIFHPSPFLKRGTAVLFKLSQPSLWTTAYHLEKVLEQINSNTLIRVSKRSFKNGILFGEPCFVGIFLQQNFLHDSQNKFIDYKGNLSDEFSFKFSFERRGPYESDWIEIDDPRK